MNVVEATRASLVGRLKNLGLVRLLLVALLAWTATTRLWRSTEGLPYMHHWDEPYLTQRALQMLKNNNLDPRILFPDFVYGGMMIYTYYWADAAYYFVSAVNPKNQYPSFDHIKTFKDGHTRTLSHPGFLLWNRRINVAYGIALLIIVYWLGKQAFGSLVGLTGAALLGVSHDIAYSSSFATTDIPLLFFISTTILLCLLFDQRKHPEYLYGAIVTATFAICTKISGLMLLSLPLLVLALNWKEAQAWWLRILVSFLVIPIGLFFFINPYAWLDLRGFLEGATWSPRTYGMPFPNATGPGWPKVLAFWNDLVVEYTFLVPVLALVGLVWAVRKHPRTLLMLGFYPVIHSIPLFRVYLYFQRNLFPLQLFIVLLAAYGAYEILRWGIDSRTTKPKKQWALGYVPMAVLTLVIVWFGAEVTAESYRDKTTLDTRVVMRDRVLALQAKQPDKPITVGVVEEVHFSAHDYQQFGHIFLPIAGRVAAAGGAGTDYLISAQFTARTPEWAEAASTLNRIPSIYQVVDSIPGTNQDLSAMAASDPTYSPKLFLMKSRKEIQPGQTVRLPGSAFALAGQNPPYEVRADQSLLFHSAGTVSTPLMDIRPGTYVLTIRMLGIPAGGQSPEVRIRWNDQVLQTVTVPATETVFSFPIQISAPTEGRCQLDFLNDAVIGGEDRNAVIVGLEIQG